MADGETTQDRSTIGYEKWAIDFFTEAISEDRVLDAVRIIAGEQIEFGPVKAGPGGIATVRAYGEIKEPSATKTPGEHVAYRVMLPIDLTIEVTLQVEQRFEAELLVPLTLRAVPRSGVRIFIEAEPPRTEEMRGPSACSRPSMTRERVTAPLTSNAAPMMTMMSLLNPENAWSNGTTPTSSATSRASPATRS